MIKSNHFLTTSPTFFITSPKQRKAFFALVLYIYTRYELHYTSFTKQRICLLMNRVVFTSMVTVRWLCRNFSKIQPCHFKDIEPFLASWQACGYLFIQGVKPLKTQCYLSSSNQFSSNVNQISTSNLFLILQDSLSGLVLASSAYDNTASSFAEMIVNYHIYRYRIQTINFYDGLHHLELTSDPGAAMPLVYRRLSQATWRDPPSVVSVKKYFYKYGIDLGSSTSRSFSAQQHNVFSLHKQLNKHDVANMKDWIMTRQTTSQLIPSRVPRFINLELEKLVSEGIIEMLKDLRKTRLTWRMESPYSQILNESILLVWVYFLYNKANPKIYSSNMPFKLIFRCSIQSPEGIIDEKFLGGPYIIDPNNLMITETYFLRNIKTCIYEFVRQYESSLVHYLILEAYYRIPVVWIQQNA